MGQRNLAVRLRNFFRLPCRHDHNGNKLTAKNSIHNFRIACKLSDSLDGYTSFRYLESKQCHFGGVTCFYFHCYNHRPNSGVKEIALDTEQIIQALRAERERLDKAIAALGGGGGGGFRAARRGGGGRRGPRVMSAEARRRISEAQKRRWAEQRKKSKS